MIYLCCYLNVRQFGEVAPLAKLPPTSPALSVRQLGEVEFSTLYRLQNVTSPFNITLHVRARYIAQKEAAYEAHLLHHLPLLRRTP